MSGSWPRVVGASCPVLMDIFGPVLMVAVLVRGGVGGGTMAALLPLLEVDSGTVN